MTWLFRHPETLAPDLVADDELTDGLTDELTKSSNYHCAWCGDEPDAYGSHSICPAHEEQMLAASRQRHKR